MPTILKSNFYNLLITIDFVDDDLVSVQYQLILKLAQFVVCLDDRQLSGFMLLPHLFVYLSNRWPSIDVESTILRLNSLNLPMATIDIDRNIRTKPTIFFKQSLNYNLIPQISNFLDKSVIAFKISLSKRDQFPLKFDFSNAIIEKSYFYSVFEISLFEIINQVNVNYNIQYCFWVLESMVHSPLNDMFLLILNGYYFNRVFMTLLNENKFHIFISSVLNSLEKDQSLLFQLLDLEESNTHAINTTELLIFLSKSCTGNFLQHIIQSLDKSLFQTKSLNSRQIKSDTGFFTSYLTVYLNFFSNDFRTNLSLLRLTKFMLQNTSLYHNANFRKITTFVHESQIKYSQSIPFESKIQCFRPSGDFFKNISSAIIFRNTEISFHELLQNCKLFNIFLFVIYIVTKLKNIKFRRFS